MLLVTGGAGYIGSHFVKAYISRFEGQKLAILDNFSLGHKKALPDYKQLEIIDCDLMNLDALNKVFKTLKVDSVIHFAAFTQVGESQLNPVKYFQNNVTGSINLVNAMADNNVNKIVFSSTCAVYGIPDFYPITENTKINPMSIYGLTKKMIEEVLMAMHDTKGFSSVILRYFNAAGASDDGSIGESHIDESHLIPLVLDSAITQKPLKVFGDDYETPDGTCIRDYIHVNDLAQAHISALDLVKQNHYLNIFNLGSGCGASILEIIKLASQITKVEIPYTVVDRRPGDPPILIANYDKAKEYLNFKPKYDIQKIIETAWQWQRNKAF